MIERLKALLTKAKLMRLEMRLLNELEDHLESPQPAKADKVNETMQRIRDLGGKDHGSIPRGEDDATFKR